MVIHQIGADVKAILPEALTGTIFDIGNCRENFAGCRGAAFERICVMDKD